MIQTVFSAELPVGERLLIRKNHIEGPWQGPRIAVVTGTHGDELEGQYVAYELARLLEGQKELLSGTVDIYPAINPLGISNIQRSVPMFDIDLNRTFPGNHEGNLTEALAASVFDDILGADVCIDVHASNIFLREVPQVRVNELSADRLLPMAQFLNVDLVWVHASATVLESTLAYALNDAGTPCLVVEMGVGMRIDRTLGDRLVDGILRLMRHLGAWQGGTLSSPAPIVSRDGAVEFLNADEPGIFLPSAQHGSRLGPGDLVGVVANPLDGTVVQEVRSEQGGWLFTLREYPMVYPGSLMARILGGE